MGLNVTVRRLRFTLSAFTPPSGVGYAETQAGHYASGWRLPKAAPAGRVCPVSAAVVASHGAVARCTFHALGGAGVHPNPNPNPNPKPNPSPNPNPKPPGPSRWRQRKR